jgi:hypothetical protein
MIAMYVVPTIELVPFDKDLMYRRRNADGSKTLIHKEEYERLVPVTLYEGSNNYPLYYGDALEELLKLDEWQNL